MLMWSSVLRLHAFYVWLLRSKRDLRLDTERRRGDVGVEDEGHDEAIQTEDLAGGQLPACYAKRTYAKIRMRTMETKTRDSWM